MQLHLKVQSIEQVNEEDTTIPATEKTIITFVETSPSILHGIPWIILKEAKVSVILEVIGMQCFFYEVVLYIFASHEL